MREERSRTRMLMAAGTIGVSTLVATTASGESIEQAQSVSLAAQETTIHGGTLVVITYFVLVGLLGAYMLWLMRRQQRLQGDIDALDQKIDGLLQEE